MALNFPIPVQNFTDLIPHRPPMVWIDEVVSASASEGEARVFIKSDALYCRQGQIRTTAPIEWMAQTLAYTRAAFFAQNSTPAFPPLTEAFLVSVRSAAVLVSEAAFNSERSVRVRVFALRDLGPMLMFDGEVLSESGTCLARASLRVFQATSSKTNV